MDINCGDPDIFPQGIVSYDFRQQQASAVAGGGNGKNQTRRNTMNTTTLIKQAKQLVITAVLVSVPAVVFAGLPNPGMRFDPMRTAIVVTDPQNDFLSEKGVTWGVVGKSVVKNNTVKNIESLFKAAKKNNIPVFVSPHYYYPTDHDWHFEGALEKLMHSIKMFDRKDASRCLIAKML
jgi:hypothetical protein